MAKRNGNSVHIDDALEVATKFMAMIAYACEKMEVVGSVRRKKPRVNDLEILCIPKLQHQAAQKGLFGGEIAVNEPVSLLELRLKELVGVGKIILGRKNGPKYKTIYVPGDSTGIKIDLFITSREKWGVMKVIRTGPAEFSRQIVVPTSQKTAHEFAPGLVPAYLAYADGRYINRSTREPLDTSTEEAVFEALNLDFIPPEERRIIQ